jgi:hypothetical protein
MSKLIIKRKINNKDVPESKSRGENNKDKSIQALANPSAIAAEITPVHQAKAKKTVKGKSVEMNKRLIHPKI